MARFLFFNLIFFYLTDIAILSYQQRAMLIHTMSMLSHNFVKIKTIPMPRVWQCSNYQVMLKPNSKAKTEIPCISHCCTLPKVVQPSVLLRAFCCNPTVCFQLSALYTFTQAAGAVLPRASGAVFSPVVLMAAQDQCWPQNII